MVNLVQYSILKSLTRYDNILVSRGDGYSLRAVQLRGEQSDEIEKKYKNAEVKFHATTRSPIEISDDTGYPLNSRFSLESFYEEGRDTFVYNLLEYDNVFIVTDCKNINEKGMINLISALEKSNNKNISLIKWGDGR